MKVSEQQILQLLTFLYRSLATSDQIGGLTQSDRSAMYTRILHYQSRDLVEIGEQINPPPMKFVQPDRQHNN